jgi:hypothetical protein
MKPRPALRYPVEKEIPMPTRLSRLALVILVAVPISRLASAQESRPVPPSPSKSAQRETVADIRNVGTALFSWLTDQVESDAPAPDSVLEPESESPCLSWKTKDVECKVAQIDKLPLISWEDLTKLLVPTYIGSVPEKDAWGNPYEYRLDTKHFLNKSVMAIRSAGKDGAFSGTQYESGAFAPAEEDQDLVWKDGFFVRWPESKPK